MIFDFNYLSAKIQIISEKGTIKKALKDIFSHL
jgi:hypothetical protein